MKKYRELKPIPRSDDHHELEALILKELKRQIYLPLLKELAINPNKVLNERENPVISALRSGQIQFDAGKFKGRFNAQISRELKKLGATWKNKTWSIRLNDLPIEIASAIRVSEVRAEAAFKKIDEKLSSMGITEIKMSEVFDKTLWKQEKKFQSQVKSITVAPKLTASERKYIADEYTNNLNLYIKDFTDKEILELRQKIKKRYLAGERYEGFIKEIENSYGVSRRKARFLARQESNLMSAAFQQTRLKSIGINKYKWRSVIGTPAHPTRPRHKFLNDESEKGKIFSFADPPVTTEPGQPERKNNPGQDFNCLLEDSKIKLAFGIQHIFKRDYTGKLATLITLSGRKFTATPNHPILTTNGWKPIQSINEFDDIICIKQEIVDIAKNNEHHSETTIGDIFTSLGKPFFMKTLQGSPAQFHGDGTAGNVDIIRTAGSLSIGIKAGAFQKFKNLIFSNAYFSNFFLGSRMMYSFKPFFSFFTIIQNFSYCFMRFVSNVFSLSRVPESNYISLAPIPYMNIAFQQPSPYAPSAGIKFISKEKFTFARLVKTNNFFGIKFLSIIRWLSSPSICLTSNLSKRFRKVIRTSAYDHRSLLKAMSGFYETDSFKQLVLSDFSGHVYNLETSSNWYIGEGNLCQMNCRCSAVPVFAENK